VLYCNGMMLPPSPVGLYDLVPAGGFVDAETRLILECREGSEVKESRTVFISKDGWSWRSRACRESPEDDSLAWGAVPCKQATEPMPQGAILPILDRGAVYYVGRNPGEIAQWPEEDFPEDWNPVWVVILRKRGEVRFCGRNLAETETQPFCRKDSRQVKRWKEIVWHRRKKILSPTDPTLQAAWEIFVEAAKDV